MIAYNREKSHGFALVSARAGVQEPAIWLIMGYALEMAAGKIRLRWE